MQHRRPPLPVIIIVVLLLAAGIYYGVRVLNPDGNGALSASGSIEATVLNVSPEMAGKVNKVFAGEGQAVKSGEPLLALDDSLLAAQQKVAKSAVESARSALLTAQRGYDMAQAQYDATLTAARVQQGRQRLADWSWPEGHGVPPTFPIRLMMQAAARFMQQLDQVMQARGVKLVHATKTLSILSPLPRSARVSVKVMTGDIPEAGAKERRLAAKKHRASIKSGRSGGREEY